jgi:hypothetical protein
MLILATDDASALPKGHSPRNRVSTARSPDSDTPKRSAQSRNAAVWSNRFFNQWSRYEERGPAISEEAKKVRARKMIRELRSLGYHVEMRRCWFASSAASAARGPGDVGPRGELRPLPARMEPSRVRRLASWRVSGRCKRRSTGGTTTTSMMEKGTIATVGRARSAPTSPSRPAAS